MAFCARIGVIGAGTIAPVHIETFSQFPDRCQVTAVCDLDKQRAETVAGKFGLKPYIDFREMIEKETLDAVCLCTPPASHVKIGLEVLALGRAILCEKPLAMTVEDGARLVEAAGKAGKLFMVAYCHRFHEPNVMVKRAIDAGEFGKLTTYRNIFANSAGYRPTRGGSLMDNGSHAADLMRFFAGGEFEVVGAQFRPAGMTDLDKVVDFSALLCGPDKMMGYLEAGGSHAGGRALIEIAGQKQSIVYDYGDTIRWFRNGNWETVQLGKIPSRFHRQAEHFLDCLEGKTACRVDVAEAQKTMVVLDRIRRKALGLA